MSSLVVGTAPLPDYRENQPIGIVVRRLVQRQPTCPTKQPACLRDNLPVYRPEKPTSQTDSQPARQPDSQTDRPTDRQPASQTTDRQSHKSQSYRKLQLQQDAKSQVFISKV
jgi:hypothetical protein